jgi:hypothetical protein
MSVEAYRAKHEITVIVRVQPLYTPQLLLVVMRNLAQQIHIFLFTREMKSQLHSCRFSPRASLQRF